MPNLIVIEEREVIAKGLNKNQTIDQEKVRSFFFDDEYENISLLNLNLSIKDSPILFYPGSGSDILTPLHYLKIFPGIKNITFIFIDKSDNLGSIKTILDDIGVSFEEAENTIKFYWNNILITLNFIKNNIFTAELPNFNIYFEKSFRAMKSEHLEYEYNIYHQLSSNGLVISDSGFQHLKLANIDVPKELSIYQEMIIGRKVI